MSITKKNKIYIIGTGNHANVLKTILENRKNEIIFISKSYSNFKKKLKCLDEKNFISKFKGKKVNLINGIAVDPKKNIRQKVNTFFKSKGFKFKKAISKKSLIHKSSLIGEEVQILNGVIIQNNTQIGRNTIVNTGSIIEHDCKIGENCFISPGCILCGNVKLGDNVYLGPKTCVISNQTIGSNTIIAGGSTITKSIKSNKFYYEKKKIIEKKI